MGRQVLSDARRQEDGRWDYSRDNQTWIPSSDSFEPERVEKTNLYPNWFNQRVDSIKQPSFMLLGTLSWQAWSLAVWGVQGKWASGSWTAWLFCLSLALQSCWPASLRCHLADIESIAGSPWALKVRSHEPSGRSQRRPVMSYFSQHAARTVG